MAELMLVNPRRRRKTTTKKRRVRRTTARKAPVRRRRRNPVTTTVRRRRRNPIARRGMVARHLQPALTAATGALFLDMAWGFLPIPANLQMGPLRYLAKGAGAIALGMVAENVVAKSTAQQMTTGAMTVIMHDALREVTQNMLPNVPLGYYSAGMPVNGMGEYVSGLNGMDAYVPGSDSTYLDNSLSTPFAGPSAAEIERQRAAECMGDS